MTGDNQQQLTPTPLSNAEQIINKIGDLQARLQAAAPGYEMLLQQIHIALSKDEEVVHLLSEEQIGIIVAGLAKKKGQVIIAASQKGQGKVLGSSGVGNKKLKDIELSDL